MVFTEPVLKPKSQYDFKYCSDLVTSGLVLCSTGFGSMEISSRSQCKLCWWNNGARSQIRVIGGMLFALRVVACFLKT